MSSDAAASSATYRKAVNIIADQIGVEPTHTRYPSEDFERLTKSYKKHLIKSVKKGLANAHKERLIEWYKRGLRRGYITACDSLIDPDGELSLEGGELLCDSKHIKIRVRLKIDGKWHKKTFDFHRKDLEFEDA